MSYLILSARGPWRSWGGPSLGDDRWTLAHPTASAAIGLLGACAGVNLHDPSAVLAWNQAWTVITASALEWSRSRRAARPGITSDYHTASSSLSMTGDENDNAVVSRRGYLEEQREVFVVILNEHADKGLFDLALRGMVSPTYTPFLGRRANPMSQPPLLAHGQGGLPELASIVDEALGRLAVPGLMEPSITVTKVLVTADSELLDGWCRTRLEHSPHSILSRVRKGVADARSDGRFMAYALRNVDFITLDTNSADSAPVSAAPEQEAA